MAGASNRAGRLPGRLSVGAFLTGFLTKLDGLAGVVQTLWFAFGMVVVPVGAFHPSGVPGSVLCPVLCGGGGMVID